MCVHDTRHEMICVHVYHVPCLHVYHVSDMICIRVYLEETWGARVDTQDNKKIFVPLSKKDKNKKNLMSVGRRRLLQLYWYKGPVLHIIVSMSIMSQTCVHVNHVPCLRVYHVSDMIDDMP